MSGSMVVPKLLEDVGESCLIGIAAALELDDTLDKTSDWLFASSKLMTLLCV